MFFLVFQVNLGRLIFRNYHVKNTGLLSFVVFIEDRKCPAYNIELVHN